MEPLESNLIKALSRRDPSVGFAERVLAQAQSRERQRPAFRRWVRWSIFHPLRVAAVGGFAITLVAGSIHLQQQWTEEARKIETEAVATVKSSTPPQQGKQEPIPGAMAHVEGIVLDGNTSLPLGGAAVKVWTYELNVPAPTVTVGEDGLFALDFNVLPPCPDMFSREKCVGTEPRIFTTKPGYGPASPDDRRIPGAGPGIVLGLAAGQRLDNLVLRMYPVGLITGKVFDPQGQPVVNATIFPYQYGFSNAGTRSRRNFSQVRTNDLGEYRITNMEPGDYFFEIRPVPVERSDPGFYLAATYYPGTTDPMNAVPVHIEAGVQKRLDNMTVQAVRGGRLRARIVNETGELPRGVTSVIVTRKEDNGNPLLSVRDVRIPKELFAEYVDLGRLPAGSYDVHLSFASISTPIRNITGHGAITTSDNDTTVDVPIGVPLLSTLMHGKAITETLADRESRPVAGVRLALLDIAEWVGNAYAPETGFQWTSREDGVFPDKKGVLARTDGPRLFRVKVLDTPPGMAVVSILSGSQDVARDGLREEGGQEQAVTVILTESAGLLTGTAFDANGKKVINGVVALVPDEPDYSTWVASTFTDVRGEFRLQAAPGSYHLYAWRELNGGAYYNPEFMMQFKGNGTPLRIEPNARLTLGVKVLE